MLFGMRDLTFPSIDSLQMSFYVLMLITKLLIAR